MREVVRSKQPVVRNGPRYFYKIRRAAFGAVFFVKSSLKARQKIDFLPKKSYLFNDSISDNFCQSQLLPYLFHRLSVSNMQEFRSYFRAFVEEKGGLISREVSQGNVQFMSGIFPGQETVQRGDPLQGGLLLRQDLAGVRVMGYVLRLVCTNGMVVPDFRLDRSYTFQEQSTFEEDLPHLAISLSRKAVPIVRGQFVRALRRQADDWYLCMVIEEMQAIKVDTAWVHRLRQAARGEAERPLPMQRVNRARWRARDHAHLSRFDVINGLTAIARDESDVQLQHQLECLAWRLLAQEAPLSPTPSSRPRRNSLLREAALAN